MTAYRIKNWDEHFEIATSRAKPARKHSWFACPNKHDGKGYKRLMRLSNGVEIFAAWILICQVASKCKTRGLLIDDDGPIGPEVMSLKTEAPQALFESAFTTLCELGWLEECDVGDVTVSPQYHSSDTAPSPQHHCSVDLHNPTQPDPTDRTPQDITSPNPTGPDITGQPESEENSSRGAVGGSGAGRLRPLEQLVAAVRSMTPSDRESHRVTAAVCQSLDIGAADKLVKRRVTPQRMSDEAQAIIDGRSPPRDPMGCLVSRLLPKGDRAA